MPAMSPTMTEGAVGSWKVKEGLFIPILPSLPPTAPIPHIDLREF